MRGDQEYQTTVSNLVEMIRKAGSIGVTIAVARNFLAETGYFAEGVVGKRLGNAFGRVLKSAYAMPDGLVRQGDRLIHKSFVPELPGEPKDPEPEAPVGAQAPKLEEVHPTSQLGNDNMVVGFNLDRGFEVYLSAGGLDMTLNGPLHLEVRRR